MSVRSPRSLNSSRPTRRCRSIASSSWRLQLKVERPAEAFAQRESPRTIQATAERRMNYDVRAAVLVKESFDDDLFLRRHRAEGNLRHREILDNLFGRCLRDTNVP